MPHSITDSVEIGIDLKRVGKTNNTVKFPIRLTKEGIIKGGFQSREEMEKSIPYLNGLPIIIHHPSYPHSDYRSVVITDQKNAVGFTSGIHSTVVDGVLIAEGIAEIYTHEPDVIKDIEKGDLKNISIGYTFNRVNRTGEFNGEKYGFERKGIMPFHAAILVEEPPACSPPFCGIGLDQKDIDSERNIYIFGKDVDVSKNIYSGEMNMPDDEKPKKEILKSKQEPISIPDMSIDSLIDSNAAVKGLASERDSLKEENCKLKTAVAEMEGFKKIVEEQRAQEVAELRGKVTELKVLTDEEIKEMGTDELKRTLKIAGKVQSGTAALKTNSEGHSSDIPELGWKDEKGEWKT